MADALRFKIENGVLAFSVVDSTAVGYSTDWQAPGGKKIDTVTSADYVGSSAQWSCQVQTATIDATANNNDETTDATWCSPAKTTPNPGETSFAINGTYLQDVIDAAGLWQFLYLYDTKEAYFYMGLSGARSAPSAIGRCRILASTFGGQARTALTSTLGPLPLSQRFDAWTGTPGSAGQVIEGLTNTTRVGIPPPAATGATAGIPGTYTPAGAAVPANLAALISKPVVASPTTAWTTGQYVSTADGAKNHWSSTAWVAGAA
jgi:hypothetical protein